MAKGAIRRLIDRGFGFIKTEDEKGLFFRRNDLEGSGIWDWDRGAMAIDGNQSKARLSRESSENWKAWAPCLWKTRFTFWYKLSSISSIGKGLTPAVPAFHELGHSGQFVNRPQSQISESDLVGSKKDVMAKPFYLRPCHRLTHQA